MTEFIEKYTSLDKDPRIMIRAVIFYLKALDKHIHNVSYLSQETIRTYIDHILEISFFLENYANQIYDELPDNDKKELESAETKRNENLFMRPGGGVDERTAEHIKCLIEAVTNRSIKNRDIAKARLC